MCEYSLMSFPNRLAHAGEDLIVHRFSSGSMGLASPYDLAADPVRPSPESAPRPSFGRVCGISLCQGRSAR